VHPRILVFIPFIAMFLLETAAVGQQSRRQNISDFYGLYYADENSEENKFALVFSLDGRPIPPKANDPDAQTQPGLYIGQQRFPFAWSHISSQGFSFRTARIGDSEYTFRGRFGREEVDILSGVPYLAGVLTQRRNGRVLRSNKVHFGHAVIL
jgi:hypothetical protein